MYGYPKRINTRQDAEYLVGFLGTQWATRENVEQGLKYLKGLRDNWRAYVFDRDLGENEEPDGSEPDYRVMEDEDGVRQQYRLEENPSAPIFRLGFTVKEVQGLIDQVEGEL